MRALVAAFLAILLPLPAQGEPVSAAVVMALDFSSSMMPSERIWQVGTLAAIFADPSIEERIQATDRDAVAVTVFRFAGVAEAPFIPWMVLRPGDGSVQRFQLMLAEAAVTAGGYQVPDGTNIAVAMLAAGALLGEWEDDADRLVVDIQTDGYQGESPTSVPAALLLEGARDALGMQGIIVNVLVMGVPMSTAGLSLQDYHWLHTATGAVYSATDEASYLAALQVKILNELF